MQKLRNIFNSLITLYKVFDMFKQSRYTMLIKNLALFAMSLVALIYVISTYSPYQELINNPIILTIALTTGFLFFAFNCANILFWSVITTQRTKEFLKGNANDLSERNKASLIRLHGTIIQGTLLFFAIVFGIVFIALHS